MHKFTQLKFFYLVKIVFEQDNRCFITNVIIHDMLQEYFY